MASTTFAVSTTSTSNVSSYASGSFTPVDGDLLVVFVVASGTVQTPSTVTDSLSGTYDFIFDVNKAAGADQIYCFVRKQFIKGAASMTVTFDCTGDAATGAVVTVYRISGMSRTGYGAVRQFAGQQNVASGTPAPVFQNACLTGNPVLGVIGNGANPAAMTPPTSWTEGSDNGYATPTTGAETVWRDSGFTGTTVTWGSSSASAFGSLVVELDSQAFSGLAMDSLVHKTEPGTGFTTITTGGMTTSPNVLLLAFIGSDAGGNNNPTVTSMSGGPGGWTEVITANSFLSGAGTHGLASIWRAWSTAGLSNSTITVNFSHNTPGWIVVVAFVGADSSGTNGSGAIGANARQGAASGAPSKSITTTRGNSWVWGTLWDFAANRTPTLGSTQVQVDIMNDATNGDSGWLQRQESVTQVVGTSVTINDSAPTADESQMVVVEILPQVSIPGSMVEAIAQPLRTLLTM